MNDDPLVYKDSSGKFEFRIQLDSFTDTGLKTWLANLRKAGYAEDDPLIIRIANEVKKRQGDER